MEALARQCLSQESAELILQHQADAPIIFAYWTNYFESSPEIVTIAFARVVEVFVSAKDYAVHCLVGTRLHLRSVSSHTDERALIQLLICSWRLLRFDPIVFLSLIDAVLLWPLLQHESRAVRYLALNVLSYYTQAADAHLSKQIHDSVGSESILVDCEGQGSIDLMIFEVEEDRRITRWKAVGCVASPSSKVSASPLPYNIVNVANVLLPRFSQEPTLPSAVVPTTTTFQNLNLFARTIATSDSILLQGSSGSGKTFLIEELAKLVGRSGDLVRIHLGDQTDAKLLLGTYVTSSVPGQFSWQEGALTTAVRQGRWLLIEDIDKAPNDVLSLLLPLLEHKKVSIPSRDEVVSAGSGFKILATKTTEPASSWTAARLIGGRLWSTVEIQSLPVSELKEVICHRFPILQRMVPTMMQVYEAMSTLVSGKQMQRDYKESSHRKIGTLDLMKWCRRVVSVYVNNGVQSADEPITQAVADDIFSEAVDCFASAFSGLDAKRLVVEVIGRGLSVPPERVAMYLQSHTPNYIENTTTITIGRASMRKHDQTRHRYKRPFAMTGHALRLMEQLAVCCNLREPTLLVGETGTGKTTIIQQLAASVGQTLVAINMSQQTESGDLLGGYKPIDTKLLAIPILETFESLFERTLSAAKNARFLGQIRKSFNQGQWSRFSALLKEAIKIARTKLELQMQKNLISSDQASQTKKRKLNDDLLSSWMAFSELLGTFEVQSSQAKKSFTFAFVEGALIRAVRKGHWVLLDEINLAAPDTLESINSLLQEDGSIILSEKGEIEPIQPHPDFRLFSCMNPATDIGKRDLPAGVRSRFTELYIQSPDAHIHDLLAIIQNYIGGICLEDDKACTDVAHLYMKTKSMVAENRLVDGANQKPHYSIRTLSRTLSYVSDIVTIYGLRRSLYEGFCMSYLTLLDGASEDLLRPIIEEYTILRMKNSKSLLSQIPRIPQSGQWVQFQHYWLPKGPLAPIEDERYIMTPFVMKNMLNLVRAATTRKYPILLQGPTSSGKTSMVEHLAKRTGHNFVRINNHEHTDLQEYLGSYVSNSEGNLVFQEGILVQAVRNGSWLVLDELNLAPTDVLEALNRLLDDNRELLIPETQEVVKPHPSFVLFATQNPAGLYGGRKHLSRAFRNRFLELHFEDIPENELESILCQRCQIAPSYCKRIVEVYKQLSLRRQSSRIFEQKNSFATLRDLFRWANRPAVGYEELAINGYLLLAERVRRSEEKNTVREVIQQVMKVSLDHMSQYDITDMPEYKQLLKTSSESDVVWTTSMRRLFILIALAFRNNEPVLLVGETGCGKTTVCQKIADALFRPLRTLNAHQNTETADLIGAQRPVRDKASLMETLVLDVSTFLERQQPQSANISDINELQHALESLDCQTLPDPDRQEQVALKNRLTRLKALFEWADGPLVQSMREGEVFLLDEISLAEDSVLERLNSVLEPSRTLVMAEKGTQSSVVVGHSNFQFCATMNPGGDFGKKELSLALRNRFTEIWVPAMSENEDVLQILTATLKSDRGDLAGPMLSFATFFATTFSTALTSSVVSIRDLLSWSQFCNIEQLTIPEAFVHGAALVYIDALGSNTLGFDVDESTALNRQRSICLTQLSQLCGFDCHSIYNKLYPLHNSDSSVAIGPFSIPKGSLESRSTFHFEAPTTYLNATRVFRAMQLRKPILLEGSPGVGKTSLISAIAALSKRALVRINFSDQTDLMDLFGSDTPVEDSQTIAFAWRDAPFLRAMQDGSWVLLDEMNLAAQSILEGLNACLDHRGQAFIPELNRTFSCHPDFRIFAAQNPHSQGGGRKGLPKSFVNRFTVVYCDPLAAIDIKTVCIKTCPSISGSIVEDIVDFAFNIQRRINTDRSFAVSGSPWEFNLRDILRWLSLVQDPAEAPHVAYYANLVVRQRLRTDSDRLTIDKLLIDRFGGDSIYRPKYALIGTDTISIGRTTLDRNLDRRPVSERTCSLLGEHIDAAESLLICVRQAWPCIIVGQSGSGKSTLIGTVANILGHLVHSIAMNNDMDASDLLGSFEQRDVRRDATQILSKVSERLLTILRGDCPKLQAIEGIDLLNRIRCGQRDHNLIREARQFLVNLNCVPSSSLIGQLERIEQEIGDNSRGHFQWSDGSLVRAVRDGHWVVLDNANLCNPSVLDRLNSLLEPNGQLIVNERIMPDGTPMVVTPHSNFRLFLTVDPAHGELSRAMRNRGSEIYLPLPSGTNTYLPYVRAEQNFWHSLDIASNIESVAVSSETYSEALLDYFPKSLVTRTLATASGSQAILLESTFKMYNSRSFETIRNAGHSPYLCTALNPKALQTARQLTAESLRFNRVLDLASIGELLDSQWSAFSFTYPRNHAKQDLAELQLLQEVGITVLQQSMLRLESKSIENLNMTKTLLSVLLYFVGKASEATTPDIVVGMLRKLRKLLSVTHMDANDQIELTTLLDKSLYLRPMTSGTLMEVLWTVLRPAVPANETVLLESQAILRMISNLDDAIRSNRIAADDAFPLQSRYLETLQDIYSPNRDLPATMLDIETTSQAVSTDSDGKTLFKDHQPLFDHILNRLHLSQLATFFVWKDTEAPNLSHLCRLTSLAHRDTVNLLSFIRPADKSIQTVLARYSSALTATLNNLSANRNGDMLASKLGTTDVTQQTGFVGHWHKVMLSSEVTQLSDLSMTLANLKQIGLQVSQHNTSMLKSTPETMSQVIMTKLRMLIRVMRNSNGLHLRSVVADAWTQDEEGDYAKTISEQCDHLMQNWNTLAGLGDHRIKEVLYDCIYHVRESDQTSDHDSKIKSIGMAWICIGRMFVTLYVPNIPLDPAMESSLQSDYSTWYLSRASSRHLAQLVMHKVFMSGQESPRIDDLANDVAQATESLNKAEHVQVYRPKKSQIHQLQNEFDYCLAAVAERGSISEIIAAFESAAPTANSQAATFLSSWEKFETRLRSYEGYQDLTRPLLEATAQIKTGLELLSLNQGLASTLSQSPSLSDNLSDPLEVVNMTCNTGEHSVDMIQSQAADISLQIAMRLKIASFQQSLYGHATTALDQVRILTQKLFEHWFVERQEREQREAEDSSLFKYSAPIETSVEDYKDLFPDYEEPDSGSRLTSSNELAVEQMVFDLHSQLLAKQSFNDRKDAFGCSLASIMNSLIELSIPHSSNYRLLHTTPRTLATASFTAERRLRNLEQNPREKQKYDFYKDSNSQEISRIVPLLTQLRLRIAQISEAWPENSVLMEIEEAVGRLLSSSIAMPLAQVLTMLEQMFGLIAQWQEVASREYSVETLFEAVRSQIVTWRRFELSCWPYLFDLEEAAVIRSDAKIWFNLYEVIIFAPSKQQSDASTEFMHQSITSLMQFMRSSSVGQYCARLRYLSAFSQHASLGTSRNEALGDLANAVALVVSYFSSFESSICAYMAREKKVLAKEVTEVIKLASWRDTNVFALRESARRSHRTLYKIVHKFRRILNAPVNEVLTSGLPETSTRPGPIGLGTPSTCSFNISGLKQLSSRPARFVEAERTASRIALATKTEEAPSQNYLKLFVDDAISSMNELRSETPTTFDKAQVALIKHLKNRKYKLLSDSFKTLKSLGLRSVLRPEKLQRQKTIEALFLTTDAVTDEQIPPIVDQYFFRIVDILPQIRAGYANHSEDVNASDIKRGTGYFDSMLFYMLKERSFVTTFARRLHTLEDLFSRYRSLILENGKEQEPLIVSREADSMIQAAKKAGMSAKMLEQLLSLTEAYFSAHLSLSTSTEKVLAAQEWWCQIVHESAAYTKQLEDLPSSIYPSVNTRKLVETFESHLASITSQVNAYGTEIPNALYMFSPLLDWLQSQCSIMTSEEHDDTTKDDLEITNVEQRLQRLCDRILLATQSVQRRSKQVNSLQDENLWFTNSSDERCKLLQAASLDSIQSELSVLLTDLQSSTISSSSTDLQALCTNYAPIIQAYVNLCHSLRTDFLNFHQNTQQCTLLIGKTLDNLVKNGFCSPQPSDPTPSDSKATQDGTGLGEGQGVDDITKDIESDEDLGDLEGLEDSKNDGEQEKDEAEAKEMQDDVGGDLEDVEAGSDKEGTSSDEEEAEEEIDDEIGEVDDQDETALDEKMWDEGPDDSRNKDTEKKQDETNQQQDDVDMVDKDEANRESEENEKEGNKQEQEPEQADPQEDAAAEDNASQEDHEDESPSAADPPENQMDAAENLELPEDVQMDGVSDTEEADGADQDPVDESEDDVSGEEMDKDTLEQDENESGERESEDEQLDGDEIDDKVEDEPQLDLDATQEDAPEDAASKQLDADDAMEEGGPDDGGKDSSTNEHGTKDNASEPREPESNEVEPAIDMDPAANEGDNAAGTEGKAMGDNTQPPVEGTSDEVRSLGEALEKFRRMLHIKDASENIKDANNHQDDTQDFTDTDQFEHIQSDQDADTQAMGPSANDDLPGAAEHEGAELPELENNAIKEDSLVVEEDIEMREDGVAEPDREGDGPNALERSLDSLKRHGIDQSNEEEDMLSDKDADSNIGTPTASSLEMTSASSLLWRKHEQDTRDLANSLCEQLRLILEPTMATKMCGDYRTGKRLNMRRIIPYIASQFKKDKIWMRRSKPSKRQYQVMLAIDDSKSMSESSSVQLAFDTVALVSTALSVLEVGQMSVVKFGAEPMIVHGFQDPFSSEAGAKVFESFTFDQTKTNVKALAKQTLEMFREARASQHSSGAELWQLQLIISDGICEDHESIRRILRQAQDERIMVIFLVIDTLHGAKKHSILQMSQVKYVTNPVDGSKKLQVQQYMEEFAFENFLIIQDVRELPELLCSTLRQFFAASQ